MNPMKGLHSMIFLKKLLFTLACVSLLDSHMVFASDAADPWEAQIREADATFWLVAFNQCDEKRMHDVVTDDMEFYHDQIGIVRGKSNFVKLTLENVCTIPNLKLRREAIPGTVTIEPLRDLRNGNKVYGAVVSGEHQFYSSEKGAPEVLGSKARFTHVMLRDGLVWRLARAISYSHKSAAADKK